MGLLEYLIGQSKHPGGFVGGGMLGIMNAAHRSKSAWGLLLAGIEPQYTVLDVGCGGGETVKLLCKRVREGKVYAIDPSERAVQATLRKNRAAVAEERAVVLQAGVCEMPFEESSFDCVTAIQTHYFWPDLPAALREVRRVLRPGGRLVMVAEQGKIDYHMSEYKTALALKNLLLDCGFHGAKSLEANKNLCVIGTRAQGAIIPVAFGGRRP